jgi:predicted ATP-grasp superfamily ATP-dependent carboligase
VETPEVAVRSPASQGNSEVNVGVVRVKVDQRLQLQIVVRAVRAVRCVVGAWGWVREVERSRVLDTARPISIRSTPTMLLLSIRAAVEVAVFALVIVLPRFRLTSMGT